MRSRKKTGEIVQAELEVLFAEQQAALLRYLTRLTDDPELAADAAQDAYLRLLESPPRDTNNVRAWLFTVATNIVRDSWKKVKTARRIKEAPQLVPNGGEDPDPLTIVERTERAEIARRLLAKLSDRERTVVLMWLEGFKHREIAETVGTTTKTVSPTIARALNKLARDIERYQRECM